MLDPATAIEPLREAERSMMEASLLSQLDEIGGEEATEGEGDGCPTTTSLLLDSSIASNSKGECNAYASPIGSAPVGRAFWPCRSND